MSRSATQRAELRAFVHRGTARARILTRARPLLKAGEGWRDAARMEAFDVSRETGRRVRTRCATGGLDAVVRDQRPAHRRRALTDEQATHLMALARPAAAEGHDHGTVRRLAGKAVERGEVAGLSPATIRSGRNNTR